jgi:hypothetical protein
VTVKNIRGLKAGMTRPQVEKELGRPGKHLPQVLVGWGSCWEWEAEEATFRLYFQIPLPEKITVSNISLEPPSGPEVLSGGYLVHHGSNQREDLSFPEAGFSDRLRRLLPW